MSENKQAEPVAWVKLTPQQLLDAYISGRENRPPGMERDALHICGIVCVQAAVLAAQNTHPAPAVAVNEQMQRDAARFEYLEKFTKCIKTPNGDLAWTIQLQQVLVGDTFGKAVDAAIEAAKKEGM